MRKLERAETWEKTKEAQGALQMLRVLDLMPNQIELAIETYDEAQKLARLKREKENLYEQTRR